MSESPKKSPRQRFREEHAQFLERLSAGLTDPKSCARWRGTSSAQALSGRGLCGWASAGKGGLPDGLAGRHAGGHS